jgi:hypothetical protein
MRPIDLENMKWNWAAILGTIFLNFARLFSAIRLSLRWHSGRSKAVYRSRGTISPL